MFNEINLIEDLESVLPEKASILGGVPMFKYNMEYSQLIVAEAPKSSMAESMRKIRTNLSYINPNYQTIAISSSISGEGKTFVALNLAGIIAMSGKKTVLLDLDCGKQWHLEPHCGWNQTASACQVMRSMRIQEDVTNARQVPTNRWLVTGSAIVVRPNGVQRGLAQCL